MKIIQGGYIFPNYQKKKPQLIIDDEQLIFNKPSIYSKPSAVLKKGKLCKIKKCNKNWCKVNVENYKGWVKKRKFVGFVVNLFFIF